MKEWRPSEEKELLQARAQLEPDFSTSKGNAVRQARLWELISSRISSSPTGEDCKIHWKSLVSRYKAWKRFPVASKEAVQLLEEIDAIYRSCFSGNAQGWGFSDEEFSSNESFEEEESEEDDVQAVLENLFQKMPCAAHAPSSSAPPPAPAWPWPALGQDALLENGVGGGCKQEVVSEERAAPRWGFAETREFIAIRAEMERDPSLHPHKNLWDPIAVRMRQRGYPRSAEQCKRKWKKLANRYKGKITGGQDNGRKFPLFQDLDDLFKARLQPRMPTETRAFVEDERPGNLNGEVQSDEDRESAEVMTEFPRKRRKTMDSMNQVLYEFVAKQQQIDKEWLEFVNRKQEEWARREREWRAEMEQLQQQRVKREMVWREQQAQRRAAEENRAQKWDKLLKVLVDSLADDDPFE